MLTKKLSKTEQREILSILFGFYFDHPDGSLETEQLELYDNLGNRFYANHKHYGFDLSTLAGIFKYASHREQEVGYRRCQKDLQNIIWIMNN